MTSIRHSDRHLLIKVLIGEPTVVGVIGLNALALFLDAFPGIHSRFGLWLEWIDYICIVYFIFEALLKIGLLKFSSYWSSGWNRFDFVIMVASLPLLLNLPFETDSSRIYAIPTLLRMGRFLRFVRVMRFVPNAAHIGQGIMRALQASVGVFLVLFVLNLTLAVGATMLFGGLENAEQYFGNPLISLYSLFKVFTVEGWYEIPDSLAASGASPGWILILRLYFVMAVLLGGILGLSLANAVFVDEMTTDNTDELENMVMELRAELQMFRAEVRQLLQSQGDAPAEGAKAGPRREKTPSEL
ncbi:MAG: ion transporter [Caldilineaceae bacterium]|nr:ion transporter [Caldilineaceae bacterium]MCB9157511.1 ion transporter [Caldilineaceae bacterium]